MAAAYAAFANGGYYTEPYSFTKLVYVNTGETYINTTKTEQVMHDYTAYMITWMLQKAASYGLDTGKYYNVNGVKYAAKTGTTNFDEATKKANTLGSKAVKDYWVVGYNTEYSIGIWYGYDKIKDGTNTLGSLQHARIFQAVAKGIFTNKDNFKRPASVVSVKIEEGNATLMLPSEYTPKDFIRTELFIKGTEPKVKSPRFAKLKSVTNLYASASNGTIHLSWTPIATPDAFNVELLTEQNKTAYTAKNRLDLYVKSLIKENTSILGTVGYNIYVVNADGSETFVGWTPNTTYDFTGYYGDVTVVVKTCYSVFKDNMADGVSVNVHNQNTTPPVIEPTTPIEPTL